MPKPTSSVLPNPQVVAEPKLENRGRRTFPAEYKLEMIAKADACKHGELGPLLRQEGLYNGQIKQWREELQSGGVEGLAKSTPGPKSSRTPEQREIERLQRENKRLLRELEINKGCISLQKKALAMLDLQNNGSEQ